MPRLPVYESQVRTRALPTPNVGVDARGAFGEGLVQGVEQLGRGVAKAADVVADARTKARATLMAEVETELQRKVTERLYNPETGLMQKRGQDAAADSLKAYEELEKAQQELAGKRIPDEDTRRVFLARTGGMLEDVRRTGERHVGAERERALEGSVAARQAESVKTAALSYADPKALQRAMDAPEAFMDQLGTSPEQRTAAKRLWRGKVAATALEAALQQKDVVSASALYAAHRELLGEQGPRFAHQLELVKVDVEAGVQADRIVGSSTSGATGWVDEGTARAQVDAMADGPLRKAISEKVEERVAAGARTKRAEVGGHYTRAFGAYYQADGVRGRAALARIPLNEKRWLVTHAPDEWEKIEVRAAADDERARALARGEPGASQPNAQELKAYAALAFDVKEHPERYAEGYTSEQFDTEWGAQLHHTDYKSAAALVAGVKGRANASDGSPGLNPAITNLIIDQGKEAGAPFSHRSLARWNQDDRFTFRELSIQVEKEATAHRRRTGNEPTTEEYKAILAPWLAQVVIPGRLFDTRVTRAEYAFSPDFADERAKGLGVLGGQPAQPSAPPRTPTSGVQLNTPLPMTDADRAKLTPEALEEVAGQREAAAQQAAGGFGVAQGAGESAPPAKVATVADVPPKHRTAIEAVLRRRGQAVTDSAILALYLQRHPPTGP